MHRPVRLGFAPQVLARIRLSHVWATSGVVIPVIVIAGTPLAVIDLAYHLRAGDIMFDTHAILRTDVFSAVAYGKPWLNQQWLAQLVLAMAFRLGGWFGLVALRALLGALVLSFVFLACRAAGAATKRAAWLTLASSVVLLAGFTLRPQLLGMGCFAVTAWLVARRRTHPEGVWIVIPITVLWANLHGSFFLAPLLLGLGWVEDRWVRGRGGRTLLLVGLGSLLATTVNPYGYRVWSYASGLATNPVIRSTITEWQPPSIEVYTGAAFFLSVVVVAALLIARVRRPVPWGSLLPLVVFFAIALAAVRGVHWWAMAAPIVLAGVLEDRPATHRTPGPRPGPQRRDRRPARVGRHRKRDPVGALRRTGHADGRQARLCAGRDHAGAAADAGAGGGRVQRAEVGLVAGVRVPAEPGDRRFAHRGHPVERLAELLRRLERRRGLAGDPGCLGRRRGRPRPGPAAGLIPRMRADPGWRLVYEDAEGLIFRRVSTSIER